MIRSVILIAALVYLPGLVFSQRNRVTKPPPQVMPPKTILVRWNMAGILDPVTPNLTFGVEYKYKPALSAGFDAGYIYNPGYYPEVKGTRGLLLRPSFRFYPGESQRAYVEAELHFKTATYIVEDWLGRNVVNGVPSYEEFTRFKYARTSLGGHLKGGLMARLSRDNRFWMDFYLGFGLRYRNEFVKDEPNSVYTGQVADAGLRPFTTTTENVMLPSVPFGFRFVVRIK